MKFLICGDLHLTPTSPENRLDNFEETSLRKFKFILDTAIAHKARAILQPGDFTDSPSMPWKYFTKIADLINAYKIGILTVYGQHDLKYRNKGNTSLNGLESACPYLVILDEKRPFFKVEGLVIVGQSYGEKTSLTGEILLIHKMFIPSERAWPSQQEYELAKPFLKNNSFKLVVSGDNHKLFKAELDDKLLINCGATLRFKINEVDHTPLCYIYDTEKRKVQPQYIPIEPNVFDTDTVEAKKNRNEELASFVEGLSQHKEMGLHFEDNLKEYCVKNKIEKEITEIIEECKGDGAH